MYFIIKCNVTGNSIMQKWTHFVFVFKIFFPRRIVCIQASKISRSRNYLFQCLALLKLTSICYEPSYPTYPMSLHADYDQAHIQTYIAYIQTVYNKDVNRQASNMFYSTIPRRFMFHVGHFKCPGNVPTTLSHIQSDTPIILFKRYLLLDKIVM